MGTYTFLAADLVTNHILAELPLSGVSCASVLNGVGDFTATLALGDTGVTQLDPVGSTQPSRTALYVDRDGVLVWGGVIWVREYDSSTKKLTLRGNDFWSYFRRRLITANYLPTGTDQLAIAQALVNTAQLAPGGDIGVAVGTERSGRLRDRSYYGYEFKPVGEAVEQLAAVIDGFDFRINVAYDSDGAPAKTLVLGYPQLGQPAASTGLVFELPGGNINSYTYPEDGTSQADTVTATGSGEGEAMLKSTASNPGLIDAGYPLLESQKSYGDVTDQATLDGHAQSDLAVSQYPVTIPEIDVNPAADPTFGSYICGDYARLQITDERFPQQADGSYGLDVFQRITKWTLQVPDAAGQAEQVKLSFGETS